MAYVEWSGSLENYYYTHVPGELALDADFEYLWTTGYATIGTDDTDQRAAAREILDEWLNELGYDIGEFMDWDEWWEALYEG